MQNLLNNNKTERLSGHSWENEIPWIPIFLKKNKSRSECRLNRRCLQSKEIPMVDLNPVVSMRKRKPSLCSPQACVSWRSSKWDESWQWEICRTISTHMTTRGAKGALPFLSFLFCCGYLGAKCQSEKGTHVPTSTETHRALFTTYPFPSLSLRHSFFRTRLFNLPRLI